MIVYILLAVAAVVLSGALFGAGYWLANQRGRNEVTAVRATLNGQLDHAHESFDRLLIEKDEAWRAHDSVLHELAKMTTDRNRCRDAHDRGAEEFERLLEAYRAVPEAFRAPLPALEQRSDIPTPVELLFDEWPMPHMGPDAKAGADLAAILGENTDVWKRVVYRPTPAPVDKTVHVGVVLPARRELAMAGPTYPAPKQRGKGKRR